MLKGVYYGLPIPYKTTTTEDVKVSPADNYVPPQPVSSICPNLLEALSKFKVITEVSALKTEKVSIAYIVYDEHLLMQLSEFNIGKISVFSKGDDDIIIPRNYVKFSSDFMLSSIGKYYNIILNHKNYRPDVEFLLSGEEQPSQDLARNLYSAYGNVIMCTINSTNRQEMEFQVTTRNLPNVKNIYLTTQIILEGMAKCVYKKYVIKVDVDSYFANLQPIISFLPSTDKILLVNASFRKVSLLKFGISTHLIAGKFEQLESMYRTTYDILNNKIDKLRKKLRLEYLPEQVLALGYLNDKIDFISAKDESYVKDLTIKYFHIFNIDDLGNYSIRIGDRILTNGKAFDRNLYIGECEVKTVNDI
jgi:hypothetical protein